MNPDWKIGDLIRGRWEIHQTMQGGMGIVYIVYDRKWREVFAAKTFQDQVFERNPNTKARFEKEASAWVNLDLHENITEARFLDVIDDKPFLFLEYVAGGDLSKWIGTPRLTKDLAQVLRFSIQFCDGMRHVISKGIKAHRDIKPQNCLVTQNAILKVTDFGLAKVLDDAVDLDSGDYTSDGLNTGLSRTGTAAGTCTHMAPEQFEDSKHVDVRADVYSFGVMLFQMVSGELPFVGRNFNEFAALHMRSPVPLNNIPNQRIRTVIERCLRKKPEDRYRGFDELRADLSVIHKVETGLPASEPVTGEKLTAFHLVNKGKSLGDLGRTDESIECFDKALSINPSLAEAWLNKGASLTEKGLNADALICFDRALALNPALGVAWSNKGHILTKLGRSNEALVAFQKAVELSPENSVAWFLKGELLATLKRYQDALLCFQQAQKLGHPDATRSVEQCRRLLQTDEHHLGSSAATTNGAQEYFSKAADMAKSGKHAEAVSCYETGLRLNPKNAEAWFNMGHSIGFLGRHNDVVKCCDRALEIHPIFSPLWILKGLGLLSMERFRDAIDCFQQAEKLGDASAAGHMARCRMAHAEWYFRLGSQYQQEGNNAEAINCYEKGIALNPVGNAIIWSNKGAALLALKRGAEAIVCFDRAIALDPRDASAWNNKGCALLAIGRQSEGYACLQEAKRLRS